MDIFHARYSYTYDADPTTKIEDSAYTDRGCTVQKNCK
jgi:hypothetical protein